MKSAKAEGLVLRASIYARKSTEDDEKSAQDRSTARQIAHAREYIQHKGWQLSEEHVYVDEAVSGAEFMKRVDQALATESDLTTARRTVLTDIATFLRSLADHELSAAGV